MKRKLLGALTAAMCLFTPLRVFGAQTGILDIESDPPGAAVFLNGQRAGETPYYQPLIPLGEYEIRVTMNGYRDYIERVKIDQVDEIRRRVVFQRRETGRFGGQFVEYRVEPMKGNVVIASIPKGAEIFIDGEKLERLAPFSKKSVEAGSYNVQARWGGERLNSQMIVQDGKTVKLVFDFEDNRVRVENNGQMEMPSPESPPASSAPKKAPSAAAEPVIISEPVVAAPKKSAPPRPAATPSTPKTTAPAKSVPPAPSAPVESPKSPLVQEIEETQAMRKKARERAEQIAKEYAARDIERAKEMAEKERLQNLEQAKRAKERAEQIEETRRQREVEEARILAEELKKQIMPVMVRIPGGEFLMGSVEDSVNARPPRKATVRDFYMAVGEVKQLQWRMLMGTFPWKGYRRDCDECPATNLQSAGSDRWADVKIFLQRVSEITGLKLRLPTEAEWEYAAGNGPKHTRYSWGDVPPKGLAGGNVADESFIRNQYPVVRINYFKGYDDGQASVCPVGGFEPNAFGLYDMTGNVWELCTNSYDAESGSIVQRGGASDSGPDEARVTTRRFSVHPMDIGLRLAMDYQ